MKIVNTTHRREKTFMSNKWLTGASAVVASKAVNRDEDDSADVAGYYEDQRTNVNRIGKFYSVIKDLPVVYVNSDWGAGDVEMYFIAVQASRISKYLIELYESGGFTSCYSSIYPCLISDSTSSFDTVADSGNYELSAECVIISEGTDITTSFLAASSSEYSNSGYEWFNLGVLTEDIVGFFIPAKTALYPAVTTGHKTVDLGCPTNDASMFDSVYSVHGLVRGITI